MVSKIIFLFITTTLCFISCSKYASFSFKAYPVNSPFISYNGYYYSTKQSDYGEVGVSIYVFYRNGTFKYCGTSYNKTLEEGIKDLENTMIISLAQDKYKEPEVERAAWGIYKLTNEKEILMERPNAGIGFPIIKSYGKILNMEKIKVCYDVKKRREILCEEWIFKSFSPKPDSINRFIP